jgi:orotate phosphoribosyltransferase-like protein
MGCVVTVQGSAVKQKLKIRELKEKLLELRAQGRSFEEITGELGMSVQELMDWTKYFQKIALEQGCNC